MQPRLTVMVVDDESTIRRAISRTLTGICDVTVAESADDAEALFSAGGPYDLVISDYAMPGRDGVELAHALRHRGYAGPILLVTGMDAEPVGDARLEGAIDDVLTKPWSIDELFTRVHELCPGVAGDTA